MLKQWLLTAAVVFSFSIASAQQEEGLIPIGALPQAAQQFVQQYYSELAVVSVWQEADRGERTEYTVLFDDGTEVEFRHNGQWKEIKARNGAVSDKVLPAKISKYVKKHYPKALVKAIDKGNAKYEVDLSNGVDLEFSLKGKFLRADD